jgi:hypothetical protein
MTTIIYPLASSWVIGDGWLHQIGFHDAAGAGYIHLLGGTCGLVGTWMLGPRIGIFDKKTVHKLVKAANLKKKMTFGKNQNFVRPSSIEQNTSSNKSESLFRLSKNAIQIQNFYNFDEDTPMKFRIYLFRQQFEEFSSLKGDQCVKLI